MVTVDERVAYLEGRAVEQSQVLEDIREDIREIRQDVRVLREDIRDVRSDMRGMEQRLDGRIHGVEDKMSRQFVWLVGIQVTVFIGIVAAILAH